MRILFSGGTGLVGRSLVRNLVQSGHSCTILSRAPARHADLGVGVQMQQWDARTPEPLSEIMEECDAVVHLAGESIAAGRWSAARKTRILESRVVSSEAISLAMGRADSPPQVLVQASAVGYYGPRQDERVTEEAAAGDDFLARVCRQWESASDAVEQKGIRRVLMRTGIVLSRSGGALPRMAIPFRFFAGGPAGSGSQWMPWIHLEDQVRAVRFLLEEDRAEGAFNLTAPDPVTNRDFSRLLGGTLGRPSRLPAPAPALRLLLGEMADLILTGQRAIPQRLLDSGFVFRFPDLEGALQDLYG